MSESTAQPTSGPDLVDLATLPSLTSEFVLKNPILAPLVSNGVISLSRLRDTCAQNGLMPDFLAYLRAAQEELKNKSNQIEIQNARIEERRINALNTLRQLVPSAFDENGELDIEKAHRLIAEQGAANLKNYDPVEGVVVRRLSYATDAVSRMSANQEELLLSIRDVAAKTQVDMSYGGPGA